MSTRAFLSFTFPLLFLVVAVSQVLAASAQAEAGDVARIRAEAKEGDFVSVRGRVVSVSRSRFFTLEDDSGGRIIAVIPNHLQRDIGAPGKDETIRVRGAYDHKTLLDFAKTKSSDQQKTWGIRVTSVERNLLESAHNPSPDNPVLPDVQRSPPAARSTGVGVTTPVAPDELKQRMAVARKRVLDAQKNLDNANAAHARAEHVRASDAELGAISQTQTQAQQEYSAALAEIGPLVKEAREVGVDETLIDLYEAGITKPAR